MLYFAYGSNMNWEQIKKRCPSVTFLGRATLLNHKIAFTRKSTRKGGVADVVPAMGEVVWGVLYRIDEFDLGRLDTFEGYDPNRSVNDYVRHEMCVFLEGKDEATMTVWIYTVQQKAATQIPPNQEYLGIIIEGAEFWHLPEEYIQELKRIEVRL